MEKWLCSGTPNGHRHGDISGQRGGGDKNGSTDSFTPGEAQSNGTTGNGGAVPILSIQPMGCYKGHGGGHISQKCSQ